MTAGKRRWAALLLFGLFALGAFWVGWSLWQRRNYRRALAESRKEIKAGRYGHAVLILAALAHRNSDSGEAAYMLGVCEKARGRFQAARDAWALVPAASPFATAATRSSIELDHERGRFAHVEESVKHAIANSCLNASSLLPPAALAYCEQGRVEDAERIIEATWNCLERANEPLREQGVLLVRLYIMLRLDPIPPEAIRAVLDRATRLAPKDDRVWLMRANLAIATCSYDDAARWLDRCLRQRPEDVAVWRAKLKWALAANRIEAVFDAARHLPAAESTPAELHRLSAWLAARRGDSQSERLALERLIAVDPADFAAWDRLEDLALRNGESERAAGLRRQKAEVRQLQDRYRKLFDRNQPVRDAVEMARLAARLGRRFVARAFLTLALEARPERNDLRGELARLKERDRAETSPAGTLADMLARRLDAG
jgi:tetratricopeptide (TPR) repeat protein